MKQNILNNIQNNNISDISDNNIYCSKCLKELDSGDRDIVKDVDGNLFCSRFCKSEFLKENYKLMQEVMGGCQEVY